MIVISAPYYDIDGVVNLERLGPGTDVRTVSRRVQRVATLDTGAAFTDGGFSEADRTFVVEVQNIETATAQVLSRMVKSYSFVNVSTPDGVFSGAPESFTVRDGTGILRVLIKEKLSA